MPETSDEYLVRLSSLLADAETHVYFDTSFLMWLVKLGRPARAEFLQWVDAHQASRFHVPLWAAHEFFKHRMKSTILSDFKSELGLFETATSRLYEKFRSYCCDDLFGFAGSGSTFLDEYTRSVQLLRAMLESAKRRGKDEIDAGILDIAKFIDDRLLAGALAGVTLGIEDEERLRIRGAIPPNFNDASKRATRSQGDAREETADNSFGDLVFWREILRHAASCKAATTLVATADRKNGWFVNFHGTEGVSPDFHRRVFAPRPVPMAHPLLVREAANLRAGNLVLMDPLYCAALMERRSTRYAAFAGAAMDAHLPKTGKEGLEGVVWTARFGTKGTDPAAAEQDVEAPGKKASNDGAAIDAASGLLAGALSKSSEKARAILRLFESGDVAVRLELTSQFEWSELEKWSDPDLVHLGRTMTMAAEKRDPVAQRILEDLRDRRDFITSSVAAAVFLGAFSALYVDEAMNRRPASGSPIAHVLLEMAVDERFATPVGAVGAALEGASPAPTLILSPSMKVIELEVVMQPSADNKSPPDLIAVKLDGHDLTTDVQPEERLRFANLLSAQQGVFDFKLGALIELVALFHLLPRRLLSVAHNLNRPVRVREYAGIDLQD